MYQRCRRSGLLLFVLALSVLLPDLVSAQQPTGTVRGRIVAAKTMRAEPSAQVSIPGTGRGIITNADGNFLLLNVPAGTHTLRVELICFSTAEQAITVQAGEVTTVEIRLTEQAVALDELVVTGTAGGTERRAIGNVVTQVRAAEAVESSLIPNVQGLLNARASNVVVMPGTGMV